jgi:hypothetical protein
VAWVRANSFQNERALSHKQRLALPAARHRIPPAVTRGTIRYCVAPSGSSQIWGKAFEIKRFEGIFYPASARNDEHLTNSQSRIKCIRFCDAFFIPTLRVLRDRFPDFGKII